jgi:hypothetical protein
MTLNGDSALRLPKMREVRKERTILTDAEFARFIASPDVSSAANDPTQLDGLFRAIVIKASRWGSRISRWNLGAQHSWSAH